MDRQQVQQKNVAGFWALLLAAVGSIGLLTGAPAARGQSAGGLVLQLDAQQSQVHWLLETTLHTVHGTFSLKGGTMHLDPATGKADGEIVVLSASGKSGNDSRDAKMHKEILESAKFAEIAFHPDRIEGRVSGTGPQDLQLHGTLLLHGKEHEMTVPVHAELGTDTWSGETKFKIPYVAWGLKDASNFFLKTKKEVQIELELRGKIQR